MLVRTRLVPVVGIGGRTEGVEEGEGLEGVLKGGGVGTGGGGVGVGGWARCGAGCDEGDVRVREKRAGGVGPERDGADEEEGTEEAGPRLAWRGGGEETSGAGNASEGLHVVNRKQ